MSPLELRLDGRVALISGGNRGIGRAIALEMARAGADVALLARDRAALQAVAEEVRRFGRSALALACDVTRADQVQSVIDRTLEHYGQIDVLVNNAGASPHDKPLLEYSENEWDDTVAVNLKGPFLLCRAAGLALLRRQGASVINVVSIAADTPIPGESAYSAAKAGLVSLTRSLAQEWTPLGVRVNALAPGYVRTDINQPIWGPLQPYLGPDGGLDLPAAPPDAALEGAAGIYGRTVRSTPLGRYGTPEEIAALAVFLASDAAAFISGSVFYADGGWQARR